MLLGHCCKLFVTFFSIYYVLYVALYGVGESFVLLFFDMSKDPWQSGLSSDQIIYATKSVV